MAAMSGLRSIMEDIAASTAAGHGAEWLNLSIGNPAPIPSVVAMWKRLFEQATADSFAEASCQYGPSRGAAPLVRAIGDYFNARYGWDIGPRNIIVGPGSQMLCFIAAALYSGPRAAAPGRVTMVMSPDYTGYHGLSMDPDGVAGIGSAAEKDGDRSFRYDLDLPAVRERTDAGLILLSSPCNPTGRCIDAAERDTLIGVAERRDIPLVLDHAYGEPFPQIGQTLVTPTEHPNVINCFSLSKAGLPGERIGFALGPERLITPMVAFLSNSALHAPRLAQTAAAIGLRTGEIDAAVATVIKPFYAGRRKVAEKLLREAMPTDIDWRLHAGSGGMFAWIWIDEDWFDDLRLYDMLKLKRVFVTPGRYFFTGSPSQEWHSTRCFRVSLTMPEDTLADGIARIAETIAELRVGRQPATTLPARSWR
jgi:valine--pyruvate aminotransferase